MTTGTGAAIVAAAREALGTPVRVQGRVPGLALDCVGLVLTALRAAGARFDVPADYSIATDNRARLLNGLAACGLQRVAAQAAGDVMEMRVAPGHHHLGIASDAGVIHADFGVGRVVEARMPPEWSIVNIWRWQGEG
ncbi:peptidoglycan endopeptidase [Pacificimonas sp. WHA3]|uniref:Peptidoglycan endopeptidase n=1 Tax=Pacificimonas pallii TaxID=2827236 RepID=A0ABS6SA74_9SPHN|nr:peptidoglycan endopeptidase [Pacificimonas pallii]MBV7255199.1 peptidoglycan endopeptidase [Pacificimonas pallii]